MGSAISARLNWANVEKWNGEQYLPRGCIFIVILRSQIYGYHFFAEPVFFPSIFFLRYENQ